MEHDELLQKEWLSSDYCLEQMLYLHRAVLKVLQSPEEIDTFLADDIFCLQQLIQQVEERLSKLFEVQTVGDYKKLCFFLIIAEAQVILNYLALHHKEQIVEKST